MTHNFLLADVPPLIYFICRHVDCDTKRQIVSSYLSLRKHIILLSLELFQNPLVRDSTKKCSRSSIPKRAKTKRTAVPKNGVLVTQSTMVLSRSSLSAPLETWPEPRYVQPPSIGPISCSYALFEFVDLSLLVPHFQERSHARRNHYPRLREIQAFSRGIPQYDQEGVKGMFKLNSFYGIRALPKRSIASWATCTTTKACGSLPHHPLGNYNCDEDYIAMMQDVTQHESSMCKIFMEKQKRQTCSV